MSFCLKPLAKLEALAPDSRSQSGGLDGDNVYTLAQAQILCSGPFLACALTAQQHMKR